MLAIKAVTPNIALDARSSEMHSIITSTQVTDASGKHIDTEAAIVQVLGLLRDLRTRGGSLSLVGNGGSAAVASHSVTDFVNVAGLRAMTLHDSSLITCMANDYGYENAFARILSTLARPKDMLIGISSFYSPPMEFWMTMSAAKENSMTSMLKSLCSSRKPEMPHWKILSFIFQW